jgi:hypothetical protein
MLLWLGATVQALIFCFFLLTGRAWQQGIGTEITFIYLLSLAWLWGSNALGDDLFSHSAQFLMLVVPLALFAIGTLFESGAVAARRANLLAERLARRKDWPVQLADCRGVPEVKALRDALTIDAAPALNLMKDPRPQVQLAALTVLEFRSDWRPGQAQLVLNFAMKAREPLLRAAAVSALASIEDRMMIEKMAEFLRDPALEVRRAAVEALLWDCSARWAWIRQIVHQALSDPALVGDGAMMAEAPMLTSEALTDLEAWATEKGVVALRAAQTLGGFYQRVLSSTSDPALVQNLKQHVANVQAPPALRVEMAQVLRNVGELERGMQEALLDPANPAPLRLLASEELLAAGPHPQAAATLRDIARMPNREMALATADIVQRRLGVDLGLALGQPLPPLHSRPAADVMRRLMKWASHLGDPARTDSDAPEGRRRKDSGSFGLAGLR